MTELINEHNVEKAAAKEAAAATATEIASQKAATAEMIKASQLLTMNGNHGSEARDATEFPEVTTKQGNSPMVQAATSVRNEPRRGTTEEWATAGAVMTAEITECSLARFMVKDSDIISPIGLTAIAGLDGLICMPMLLLLLAIWQAGLHVGAAARYAT